MPAAARKGDTHVCLLFNGPIPHVGGVIKKGCASSVMIGGAAAATQGSLCECIGKNPVLKGSSTVFIEGKPAAREGDPTTHKGGTIKNGFDKVLIGG